MWNDEFRGSGKTWRVRHEAHRGRMQDCGRRTNFNRSPWLGKTVAGAGRFLVSLGHLGEEPRAWKFWDGGSRDTMHNWPSDSNRRTAEDACIWTTPMG